MLQAVGRVRGALVASEQRIIRRNPSCWPIGAERRCQSMLKKEVIRFISQNVGVMGAGQCSMGRGWGYRQSRTPQVAEHNPYVECCIHVREWAPVVRARRCLK